MAGADAAVACPHPIDDVAMYCPSCHRLVLVRTDLDRTALDLQIMILTVASLGAGVLFRLTNQVWPAYLFLGLALTFLYAVVFSRGDGTLWVAAGGLSLVTSGWLGWWLIGREVHLSGATSAALHALPALVLLISLVAVLWMRRWALPVAKEPGTYLLAAGVFTLGFWGVWATLLQGNLVSLRIYQTVVVLGFLAPLAFIPLIRKWRPYQDENGSLIIWGAIVVGYLMVADLVVRGLGYVLGQLFPHILGLQPLPPMRLRLSNPDLRAALTVTVLGIILLIALTDSIVVVWKRFRDPEPEDPANANMSGEGEHAKFSVGHAVEDAAKRAVGPGAFAVDVAREFFNKFLGFARLINLVVPVVIFTALSILFILMLDVFREYNTYGAFADPTAIWGMAILTMFLALVGYAVAVYFAPWAYDSDTATAQSESPTAREGSGSEDNKARKRNWPAIVNGSAVLLSGFYIFVSVASVLLLAVWLTLWVLKSNTRLFTPGPIYLTNIIFAAVVVSALLALGFSIDRTRRRRQRAAHQGKAHARGLQVSRRVEVAARYVLPLMLVLLTITAMVFGARPMIQAGSFVLRSHDEAADKRVRTVVPADILGRCVQDHLVLTKSRADLSCPLGGALGVVSYHLFASNDEMNQVYATVLNGRRLNPDVGSCGGVDNSTATYAFGQVGCYTYGGLAWIVWTDKRSNVLSLCNRPNEDPIGLYDFWRTHVLGPVAPANP